MIRRINGKPWGRFCGPACRDGFVEDQRYGAIYSAVHAPEGVYQPLTASLRFGHCAYCHAQVVDNPRIEVKPDFGPEYSRYKESATDADR